MAHAADPRPTVLLTGFGPFPGIPRNASADLVRALAREARRALPDHRIVTAILPTEWLRAPQLVTRLHARHSPVLVLHFGVAEGARGFRFETEGRNHCRAAKDAVGSLPASTSIAENGPTTRSATIAVAAIARTLERRGYPVSLSDDAGGYLCNAILYHSLACAEDAGHCRRVGFIHVPSSVTQAFQSTRLAVAGALEIVKGAL